MGKSRKSLFSRAFGGFFTWFQPRQWTSYDTAKKDAFFLLRLLRSTLSRDPETGRRKKSKQHANFADFCNKENLTEKQIESSQKAAGWYALLYFFSGACVLFYTYFLWRNQLLLAMAVTVLLAVMLLLQGVSQHIICLRLKHRNLNIGLGSWLKVMRGNEPPPEC